MARRPRVPGTTRPRVAFALPAIDDEMDINLKNAIATRNAATVEGRSPACGCVPVIDVDRNGIGHLTFAHEPSCPAMLDDGRPA